MRSCTVGFPVAQLEAVMALNCGIELSGGSPRNRPSTVKVGTSTIGDGTRKKSPEEWNAAGTHRAGLDAKM